MAQDQMNVALNTELGLFFMPHPTVVIRIFLRYWVEGTFHVLPRHIKDYFRQKAEPDFFLINPHIHQAKYYFCHRVPRPYWAPDGWGMADGPYYVYDINNEPEGAYATFIHSTSSTIVTEYVIIRQQHIHYLALYQINAPPYNPPSTP